MNKLMNKQIAIKDILPNPFRNIEHYKINEKKVEHLIKSFETTGVWPVIIGRQTSNGKIELAFGHHRKEAARQLYGDDHEIEVIVAKLDDEQMLKYMANENQHEFATSFATEMETTQAVVKAFADDKIKLDKPEAGSLKNRYAPKFSISQPAKSDSDHAYTAVTVGKFLGWLQPNKAPQRRIYTSIAALELIEEGYLKLSQLEDQTVESCRRIIQETTHTRDERIRQFEEAKDYADRIETDYQKVKGTPQEKELSYQHKQSKRDLELAEKKLKTEPAAAAERVTAYERNRKKKEKEAKDVARAGLPAKELPTLNQAAEKLRRKIEHVLTSHDELGKMLKEIIEFRKDIDIQTMRFLALALGRLCKRSERCVIALGLEDKQLERVKAPLLQ